MDRLPPILDANSRPAAEVLQRVFALLDGSGIAYCLSHGYEGLPDRWGSDIDIIVARQMTGEAVGALLDQSSQFLGARVVRRESLFVTLACASRNGIPQYLVLDFSHDAEGEPVLAARRRAGNWWIPSTGDAFAIELTRAIAKSRLDDATAERLAGLYAADPAAAHLALGRRWPARLADEVGDAVARRDWASLIADAPSLRRRLVLQRMVCSPLAFIADTLKVQVARARRFLRPAGVHVALLGPDGAGKSSTIAALEEGLAPLFARVEVLGFAPSLRQLLRRAPSSTATPHALKPRSAGMSLIRAAYWAFHAIASHVTLRVAKARSTLVLNDRHFIDILVDPVRYRYGGPRWALKAVWWLTPRPDLVILLNGAPEVLQARKREITVEATARLCRGYLDLVSVLPCGWIVNAEQKPEAVIGEAAAAILAVCNRGPASAAQRPVETARPAPARLAS